MRVQSAISTGKRAVWRSLIGWSFSAALHAGVLALAIYGLPMLERPRPETPPPVEIDFIRIASETTTTKVIDTPEEAPELVEKQDEPRTSSAAVKQTVPKEVKPEALPTPTAEPVAEAVPLREPEPKKPAPKPKPKISPEEQARRTLRSSVQPSFKPKPPSRVDTNRLAALIDRSKKEEDKRQQKIKEEAEKKAAPKPEEKKDTKTLFAGVRSQFATASLRDALARKLSECWNFPGGAKGVERFSVVIRIYLKADGTLARTPEYVRVGDLNDGFYRAFAESALRAVRICEPFNEAIPYVKSGNSYIDFNFDGAEFGG